LLILHPQEIHVSATTVTSESIHTGTVTWVQSSTSPSTEFPIFNKYCQSVADSTFQWWVNGAVDNWSIWIYEGTKITTRFLYHQ